jgi:MerR family transcriptional regulator, light-induced transcriptional regulator
MPKRATPAADLPRHPIQVVAHRTRLSADVIRAWEKRYEVVEPTRSAAGRRLYSNADVARLQQLARATLSGRTIGQVAGLAPAALTALLRADAADGHAAHLTTAAPTDGHGPGDSGTQGLAAATLTSSLAALARFDPSSLDTGLRRAAVALAAGPFLDALVVPLWQAVLDGVRAGTLRLAHEHLALALLRRALDRLLDAAAPLPRRPDLVVATPLGQPAEFGALLVAAAAVADGWRVLYAGPGVPAEALAELVVGLQARAVVLGLASAAGDRVAPRELRRLRALLPAGTPILVHGAAADAHRGVLREVDAVAVRDSATLRTALRARLGE